MLVAGEQLKNPREAFGANRRRAKLAIVSYEWVEQFGGQLADFEFWFWIGAGLVQLLLPFLLAYAPQSKMKVYLVNFVGYSVLALGGCLGDRLRAICIGGLLLGASLTLGIAHERGKRLTFLQASREAPMVGVHIAKEPSEVWRRPKRGASACSSSHKRVARALSLIVAQALLMALLMVNSDMPYFARAVLVLIVAGLGYAVQWILVAQRGRRRRRSDSDQREGGSTRPIWTSTRLRESLPPRRTLRRSPPPTSA